MCSEFAMDRGGASPHFQREVSFELLVRSVQEYAIFMMDPEGRVLTWNEGAARIKGYSEREVLGQPFTIFFPDEMVQSGFPAAELERARECGQIESEGWRRRKDGSQFWASAVITALRGDEDALIGFAKVTRDMTERRNAEDQARRLAAEESARAMAVARSDELAELNTRLREQSAQLEAALASAEEARKAAEHAAAAAREAYHELDQFAYAASHDLRAPLRGVSNLAQWIEADCSGALTAESVEHMRLLQGRVRRMEALIEGILAYSRAGRTAGKIEMIDTGKLVRSVVDLLSPPVSAQVEIAPGMPLIKTERLVLEQVLMNLIGNAIKHGHVDRPEVTVRVTARDLGEVVEFAVVDDGPGIAPEYHDRVWGIFQTLASRDKVEGTGVGLALVKKIVERRGGSVSLQSEKDKGATFRFTWPKQEGKETEA